MDTSEINIKENTATESVEEIELIEVNPARHAAVKILTRFERSDAYLDILMAREMEQENISQLDKALLTELVNGVIRWRWKLDWVLTGFYRGDYLKCLNIVKNALRVGLYQILFLDKIPDHAAINEAVEMIKRVQGDKIAGIVNGVLRNIARNIENIRYPAEDEDVVYYYTIMESHPRWMVKRWLDLFGLESTVKLLKANNEKPYTTLRINKLKADVGEVLAFLRANGIEFTTSPYTDDSITIKTRGIDLASLNIFREGKVSVQDTSASLATKLANAKPGDRILDMCAAPGGKSFCLAEQIKNDGEILAIDKYPSKLRFIKEGTQRLGITCITTKEADSSNLKFDEQFDIVFLDAPCSGLGTITKKPDIRWKRDREDVPGLVNIQRGLLENAAHQVKVGGTLVYSTCTIEPDENESNVIWFLKNHPEFELDPAENYLHKDICKNGFMQTYQHIHKCDGAFASRLIKKAETLVIISQPEEVD